jgi:hypothetical protein
VTRTFDEYFRVFSNYTDKELIAVAQPERSDKMERSELHALVQVMAKQFDELVDLALISDETERLLAENEALQDEVQELEEKIDQLEDKIATLERLVNLRD